MACIGERSDGDLFACGANWDPDLFALGRSTDGQGWDGILRFSEISGPLGCAPGTVQFDTCAALLWPALAEQFGIGSADAGPMASDAGTDPKPKDKCTDCSAGGPGGWLPALLVAPLLLRRRRRVLR